MLLYTRGELGYTKLINENIQLNIMRTIIIAIMDMIGSEDMIGSLKKSHSPSSTTVNRRRFKTRGKKALNPSFADLPSSLLEVIMSNLVLKDNMRASGACKSWREAAVSVRDVEQHPWLMCFPKRSSLFKLWDPLQWKSYTLNLPELAKSTVCYLRDGWLLMHRSNSSDMFFFNPFSRELISLPKLDLSFHNIAFSFSPMIN